MTKLIFTPAAKLDMENIYDYSARSWGYERSEQYLSLIYTTCQKLNDQSLVGQDASYIRDQYQKYPIKSHLIFYKQLETETIIIRILHQRQNVEDYF